MKAPENYLEVARRNQGRAREIIDRLGIVEAWEKAGATINLVGSLRTGLLVKHRDIDFHIYTERLDVARSFETVSRIASRPGVGEVTFGNLAHTDEKCLEWHAWYTGPDGERWQVDMIQIEKGSRYDGHMERVADRIMQTITHEQRDDIMRLKYETPDHISVMGIEYYVAVMRDGVRDFAGFTRWREANPVEGVVEWIP